MNLQELRSEFQRTGELREFREYEKIEFRCFECGKVKEETISGHQLESRIRFGKNKVCLECKEQQGRKSGNRVEKLDLILERLDRIEKLLITLTAEEKFNP